MRGWKSGLAGAALAALTLAPAFAAAPPACAGKDLSDVPGLAAAEAKRADDLVNGDGLLWRIDKPGRQPSWLFGTIHSTLDSALAVARRAAEKIDGAKVVATEIRGPLDAMEKANIGAEMLARALVRDHDTFDGVVPDKDRPAIEAFLAQRGYPVDFAHHVQLWLLALTSSLPICEAERQALDLPEVDQFLAETGVQKGVELIGLETVKEQLDALAGLSPQTSEALIAYAAAHPKMSDDAYVTMLRLYQEGRPAEILPITDILSRGSPEERRAEDDLMRALLTGRNARMAERAAPLLDKGGAFIAVGALHLPGKDGLIERFRAMGYTVTKQW